MGTYIAPASASVQLIGREMLLISALDPRIVCAQG